MNTVLLTADGRLEENRKPVGAEPLGCLGCRVQLAEETTLRSFFRMIEAYPVLANINAFFPSYLQQVRACPPMGCTGAGFDRLVFGKTVEMIGFPGDPRLEIYHSLSGATGTDIAEIRSSRLEGLLDLPLRLGKLRHVVFGDKMDVFEFETAYNLFEFIDGIAWELSFHGTPEACEIRR